MTGGGRTVAQGFSILEEKVGTPGLERGHCTQGGQAYGTNTPQDGQSGGQKVSKQLLSADPCTGFFTAGPSSCG